MSIDDAYRAGMIDATAGAERRIIALTEMLRHVEAERDMLKKQVAEIKIILLSISEGEQSRDSTYKTLKSLEIILSEDRRMPSNVDK